MNDEEPCKTEVIKQLKKIKESKKNIENEYFKCEKELRIKTEEVEKLKLEIRHLKQIVELRENLKDKDVDVSTNDDGIDESNNEGYWIQKEDSPV